MDVREKLVELLNNSFAEQYEKRGLLTAPHTATDLIANGVTVQEWISVKDRLPTNADRIRAMSDEELAKNLVYEMCNYCYEHRTEKCYRKCADNMLEWLKQPAE